MSDDNVYDLFGEHDDTPDEHDENATEGTSEVDPSLVAFMDQQSAEFNAKAEHEFADRYGFVHKCKCDQDFSSGNMVEVTECYANMTLEALDACAELHAENKLLRALIQTAIGGTVAAALTESDESEGSETD
jgi:hypothetical protein